MECRQLLCTVRNGAKTAKKAVQDLRKGSRFALALPRAGKGRMRQATLVGWTGVGKRVEIAVQAKKTEATWKDVVCIYRTESFFCTQEVFAVYLRDPLVKDPSVDSKTSHL